MDFSQLKYTLSKVYHPYTMRNVEYGVYPLENTSEIIVYPWGDDSTEGAHADGDQSVMRKRAKIHHGDGDDSLRQSNPEQWYTELRAQRDELAKQVRVLHRTMSA